ncbi:hypothetical protein HK097_002952 [Rhizophlyctis rosea]|uniref:Uncharacterized protein n=1 Tax=Rhizophlyctis rosea TaxID=64517 RepID=A0AAD5S2Y8_9FUNG|nr:hypothetical protein HK097_002952 [Rhizophlyctis rosea]
MTATTNPKKLQPIQVDDAVFTAKRSAAYSLKTAGYAVLHLLHLVTASVFVWGISNHAQFGPDQVCLLYVRDYRATREALIFSAHSSACPNSLGVGTTGIILALIIGLTNLTVRFKPTIHTNKPLTLIICLASALFAIISLTMAIFATDGLNKSCEEFASLEPARTCKQVFATGFYDNDNPNWTFYNSLDVVQVAIGNCWAMGALWALFAGLKGWEWRFGTVKWW